MRRSRDQNGTFRLPNFVIINCTPISRYCEEDQATRYDTMGDRYDTLGQSNCCLVLFFIFINLISSFSQNLFSFSLYSNLAAKLGLLFLGPFVPARKLLPSAMLTN